MSDRVCYARYGVIKPAHSVDAGDRAAFAHERRVAEALEYDVFGNTRSVTFFAYPLVLL